MGSICVYVVAYGSGGLCLADKLMYLQYRDFVTFFLNRVTSTLISFQNFEL